MLMLEQRQLTSIGFGGSRTVTKQSPFWIKADFGFLSPPWGLFVAAVANLTGGRLYPAALEARRKSEMTRPALLTGCRSQFPLLTSGEAIPLFKDRNSSSGRPLDGQTAELADHARSARGIVLFVQRCRRLRRLPVHPQEDRDSRPRASGTFRDSNGGSP